MAYYVALKKSCTCYFDILLKPAGDAPIMKKKKWTVDRTKKICWVSDFIKKYIKIEPSDSLFLYVNQSYAPSPDTDIGSIFDCFGSDGKLVLHYCKTQAWG
ncbi:Ubiquitin-like protein [Bulinus truncatus]|nr:Ubiquitin-like protein [Bulinus truncatus]